MGSNAHTSKEQADEARSIPTLGMSDVILGNIQQKAREHAELEAEVAIKKEKEELLRLEEEELRLKKEAENEKIEARRLE